MEPLPKRQRLAGPVRSYTDASHDSAFHDQQRMEAHAIRAKLKGRFEDIFEKYEKDFSGIGDEIDLMTGEVVVNNGHLAHMRDERDARGEVFDWGEEIYEDSEAEEDELATFSAQKMAPPRKTPNSRSPDSHVAPLNRPPLDPIWAAPEIPGLRDSASQLKLAFQDEPLDNASERSISPERSLWDTEQDPATDLTARTRQTWTSEELSVLHKLKDTGGKWTLRQLQEHLPHRGLTSIRLRWLQMSDQSTLGQSYTRNNGYAKRATQAIAYGNGDKGAPNISRRIHQPILPRSAGQESLGDFDIARSEESDSEVDAGSFNLTDGSEALERDAVQRANNLTHERAFNRLRRALKSFGRDRAVGYPIPHPPTPPNDNLLEATMNRSRSSSSGSYQPKSPGSSRSEKSPDFSRPRKRGYSLRRSSPIQDGNQAISPASEEKSNTDGSPDCYDDGINITTDQSLENSRENNEYVEIDEIEQPGRNSGPSPLTSLLNPVSNLPERGSSISGEPAPDVAPNLEELQVTPKQADATVQHFVRVEVQGLAVSSDEQPAVERRMSTPDTKRDEEGSQPTLQQQDVPSPPNMAPTVQEATTKSSQRPIAGGSMNTPKRKRKRLTPASASPVGNPKSLNSSKYLTTPRNRTYRQLERGRHSASPALSSLNGGSDEEASTARTTAPGSARPPRKSKFKPGLSLPLSEKRPVCGRNGFSCGRSICLRCAT